MSDPTRTPADPTKIRFHRRPPRRSPACGGGLKDLTLVGVSIDSPFKPDEQKLIYDFEVDGFPYEEHGTVQVFGQADGSMNAMPGGKSNNAEVVTAFNEDPESFEGSPTDFVGKKCKGLITLKKGRGDKEYPRITALLAA